MGVQQHQMPQPGLPSKLKLVYNWYTGLDKPGHQHCDTTIADRHTSLDWPANWPAVQQWQTHQTGQPRQLAPSGLTSKPALSGPTSKLALSGLTSKLALSGLTRKLLSNNDRHAGLDSPGNRHCYNAMTNTLLSARGRLWRSSSSV